MSVTIQIKNQLEKALKKAELPVVEIHLEHPADLTHGDYATNVALVIFGQLDDEQKAEFNNPRQLAEKLVSMVQLPSELVSEVSVAGPGFINFTLSEHFLLEELEQILTKSEQLVSQMNSGKKVIVEYSSPNIAKPFTIGHLRSTIIGNTVANLLVATGGEVMRDNHLGDWGTQFGKQIYAIKTWGDETKIEESERPVKELVELYVKFHQEAEQDSSLEEKGREWFKKLEDGDEEARRLWQRCIDWSWKEFSVIYQRLGISFSSEFNDGKGLGESFFEDKMAPIIEKLEEDGLIKEGNNGAKLFFFEEDKYPPAMILKQDGATLYHTRDLATDKYRLDTYQPDLIINEVGAEQELYFKQLFEMEQILGWYQPEQRVHVKHGMFRFEDKKMSTRKGNVIWLEDVLQEAYDRVARIAEERLDEKGLWKIAIGALKWNDLKRKAELNVVFDWDEIIRLDGNSGPYVQYTFTRCQSVLDKADFRSSGDLPVVELNKLENQILRTLMRFGEVVEKSAQELAPHHLCTYLFELSALFNSFYNQHQILGAKDEDLRALRLHLTQAVATVLDQGLDILGIETLKKM